MPWHRTVSFRVIAGSLALLLLSFALYAYLTIRFYDERMMAQARDGAHRVSDVLESSTRYSMLLNRKADVYQSIRTVAREQPGVEGIRIYNKTGVITFSTDDAERNTLVNLGAEACYGCHARGRPLTVLPIRERSRIYRTRQGYRVLGVITPIRNSPECAAAGCHVAPARRTILGVLDVRVSLKPVDAVIARATARTLWVTAIAMLAVALAAYVFLDATVRRPIRALREGTRQIAAGNLEHEIAVGSDDDLGDLARSFNAMTRSLRAAQAENRSWAESLEERVRQKSDEIGRMHAQILQVEKMASLGTLAATVAHEINNPLSGILTYARLNAKRIRREGGEGELERKVLQDLDLIAAETQRCGAIVNNLLLFSRKQVGEFHLVSLGDVVERARGIVAHHLAMANVRLTAVCEPPDLAVVGDEGQLQQALVALFVNATEAMPDGGELTVTARREAPAGEVRLSVADTGGGIAPEDLAHVFEPFFTTKRSEGQGVGLGLSVVYGIVERHGAAITVGSQLGQGTTFTITFPPADRGPSRAAAGAAVTAATSGDAAGADAAAGAPGPEEPA